MAYGYGTGINRGAQKGSPVQAPPGLPDNRMDLARSTQDRSEWFDLKRLYQQQDNRSDTDAYHQALYSNPLAGQFDTETGTRRGLLGRIKQAARQTPAFSYPGRVAMGKIGAFVGGASLIGAASAGAGGGAGAGAAGFGGTAGGTSAGGLGGIGGVGGTNMSFGGLGLLSKLGSGGGSGGSSMASWAPWVQGGSQLISGYLDKRASDKARNQQQGNLQNALAQLSPEAIRQLMQMFYTQNYAMLNPAMQSAQRGVAAGAARTGLTGAGVVQQLRAGIPGQFANAALGQAGTQAFGVAGQRAGLYGNAPVSSPYSFGGDLQGLMQMLGRYGLLRNQGAAQTPDQNNQWWIPGPDNKREI